MNSHAAGGSYLMEWPPHSFVASPVKAASGVATPSLVPAMSLLGQPTPRAPPPRRLTKDVYVPLSRILSGDMDSQQCRELQRRVTVLEEDLTAAHHRELRQQQEIDELKKRLACYESGARVYSL